MIADIPGRDGWYSTAAHETFQDLAAELLAMGASAQRATDALRRVCRAAADDCGA